MKKILYVILLLIPTLVLASNEYEITNYSINVNVNSNHTYNYEEKIDLRFNGDNTLLEKELDDSIHNFKSNQNYSIETSNTSVVKIYSKNRIDTFHFSYNKIDKEHKDNKYIIDIKNNYNNDIDYISFNITLPKDVTKKNIVIYNGKYDLTDIVDFEVDGNVVTGTFNKLLKTDETLVIEVDYNRLYMSKGNILCISIPLILAFISYLLWYYYGKDLQSKTERTSKLPKNLSILDIALVNKGEATKEDTYYLLLSLASKGYITIKEDKDSFIFKKNKDYDGKVYNESIFMKYLFREGDNLTLSEYVNILSEKRDDDSKIHQVKEIPENKISRKFKLASEKSLHLVNTEEEKHKYFESKSDSIKIFLLCFVAIILILVTSFPFLETNRTQYLPISFILSIFSLYILIKTVNSIDLNNKYQSKLLLCIITIAVIIALIIPTFKHNVLFVVSFIISILSALFILFLYKYMPKRTIYGQRIKNKIDGFKDLLKNHRKEEINNIIELEEDFISDSLPPAYELNSEIEVYRLMKERKINELSWLKLSGSSTPLKIKNAIEKLYKILTKE